MRRGQIEWVDKAHAQRRGPDFGETQLSSLYQRPRPHIPLARHDEAVFLLHTAAEIEHSLLVQYLYAAYSLGEVSLRSELTGDQKSKFEDWQDKIATIAVEEMAHLVTVQNVLLSIGGPLSFDREDYPFGSDFYPFPFALRPLNKDSLARFIAAEMPAISDVPASERREVRRIVRRATNANANVSINRVGPLYDQIIDLIGRLNPHKHFVFGTANTFQAQPSEWGAAPNQTTGRIIWTIDSQSKAQDGLRAVQQQGEAPDTGSSTESHFRRFLEIYRVFPETNRHYGLVTPPIPALPVATNPNTLPRRSSSRPEESARITDRCTRYWAHLFNLRYRLVLYSLQFYFRLPYVAPDAAGITPANCRSTVLNWALTTMKPRIKVLAKLLARKPRKDPNIFFGERAATAGAPFELPYTLALPRGKVEPWMTYRDLAKASQRLIDRIRQCTCDPDDLDLLDELTLDDTEIKVIANSQFQDPNRPCTSPP